MPQRRTAIKDLRKNQRNHMHNLDIKTDLKKTIKKFIETTTAKNATESKDLLKTVYKKIDKAAKSNIMHKKTAARRKSKFARLAAVAVK